MSGAPDKAALRAAAAEARAGAHGKVDAGIALASLRVEIGSALVRIGGPVAFYWPMRTEIDPRPVMELMAGGVKLCLPVTQGREAPLRFRQWEPGAEMARDGFGVMAPVAGAELVPRVLVVPMLAFDEAGHRLGYGAGHYDRTLAGLRAAGPVRAIGFAYEAQRIEALPAEATDQRLDRIVTEEKVRTPLLD